MIEPIMFLMTKAIIDEKVPIIIKRIHSVYNKIHANLSRIIVLIAKSGLLKKNAPPYKEVFKSKK
jgi:hypothetical protein